MIGFIYHKNSVFLSTIGCCIRKVRGESGQPVARTVFTIPPLGAATVMASAIFSCTTRAAGPVACPETPAAEGRARRVP